MVLSDGELFGAVGSVYADAKEIGTHCMSERADYTTLLTVCRKWGLKLGAFYSVFLRGLYTPEAVQYCSKALRKTTSLTTATMALAQGLARARAFDGAKSFPYAWLKDGDVCWKQLMTCTASLWKFAGDVVDGTRRTRSEVDSLFPARCGPHSFYKTKKKASRCCYMRRHLTRFITILVFGFRAPLSPACWTMACSGMGSGPKVASELSGCCDDFAGAGEYCHHLQKQHGKKQRSHCMILQCSFVSM
ncbi:unnamed protein product [Prorocentrum cordatum]|uniref:Uncharacterized protein n=1 Tax=Prorocentrum cordatum TaxID=2364126 RepID=A0ABN9T413_9DINO|nr:unnamed protein product [Polarella glacialis]